MSTAAQITHERFSIGAARFERAVLIDGSEPFLLSVFVISEDDVDSGGSVVLSLVDVSPSTPPGSAARTIYQTNVPLPAGAYVQLPPLSCAGMPKRVEVRVAGVMLAHVDFWATHATPGAVSATLVR